MSNSSLGSVTGRDEFIIAEALATALIALEQLPDVRQPTHNMADMKMLSNSLYPPPEVSLHLTTARWRFIPSARPFGAGLKAAAAWNHSDCPTFMGGEGFAVSPDFCVVALRCSR